MALTKEKFLDVYNKKAGSIAAIAKELGVAEKLVEDMEWTWAIYPESIQQMQEEKDPNLEGLIRSFSRHVKKIRTKYKDKIELRQEDVKLALATDGEGNVTLGSKEEEKGLLEKEKERLEKEKIKDLKMEDFAEVDSVEKLQEKLREALKESLNLFHQAKELDKKLQMERDYNKNLQDEVEKEIKNRNEARKESESLKEKMKDMVPIPPKPKATGKFIRDNIVMPTIFPQVVALAKQRMNILLVGPTGCGKTTIAELIAKDLKLPFRAISVSRGITEGTLGGRLLPSKGGVFKYAISEFVLSYEKGGVILLDELDAGDDNTLVYINNALGGSRCSVPNRLEKPFATRHKDFVCIGAANTYGNGADRMYVGRNQLDAATLDRFSTGTIFMDYDPVIEEKIVREDILAWGRKLRERIRSLSLRRSLSTRFLKDITIMANNSPEFYGKQEDWFGTLTQSWNNDEIARIK